MFMLFCSENFSDDSSNITGFLPSITEEEDDKESVTSYKKAKSERIIKFLQDQCCLCFLPLQIYKYLSKRAPKVTLIFNTLQLISINTFLSMFDVFTDIRQAFKFLFAEDLDLESINNGEDLKRHFAWGSFTLAFIFVPALLSFIFHHKSLKGRFCAMVKHLPLWQFYQHYNSIVTIFKSEQKVRHLEQKASDAKRQRKRYLERKHKLEKKPEEITEIEEITRINQRAAECKANSEDLLRRKNEEEQYLIECKSKFDEFRIYEAYGESFPQFVLQLTIILKRLNKGKDIWNILDHWTILSLVSSYSSLILTVSGMTMTLPIFYKGEPKLLIQNCFVKFTQVLPMTMLTLTPRLLALSLFFSSHGFTDLKISLSIISGTILIFSFAYSLKIFSQKRRRDKINLPFTAKEKEFLWLGYFTSILTPTTIFDLQWNLYMYTSYISSLLYCGLCFTHLALTWTDLGLLEYKELFPNKTSDGVNCSDLQAGTCPSLIIKYQAADSVLIASNVLSMWISYLLLRVIRRLNRSELCLWAYLKNDKKTWHDLLTTKKSHEFNATDDKGRNLFLLSIEKSDTDTIHILLQEDTQIDLNCVDFEENNALTIAFKEETLDIFKLLYQSKRIKNHLKDGILLDQCSKGNLEMVQLFFKTVHKVNNDVMQRALNVAYREGHIDVIQFLFKRKDLSSKAKDNLIMQVLADGATDVFELIVDDVNYKDNEGTSLLMLACRARNNDTIRMLLQKEGIDINGSYNELQRNVLMYACVIGDIQLIKLILQFPDFEVNAQDFDGKTSLMFASKEGHKEVVKLLLEKKPEIDVNIEDKSGDTAFIFACMKGHTDVVKLLLEEDIDFKDGYSWAHRHKHESIIQLLEQVILWSNLPHSDTERLNIDLTLNDKICGHHQEIPPDFNPFNYGEEPKIISPKAKVLLEYFS